MRKNIPLFLLQAALAAVALVPSASELAQPLDETPIQTGTRPVPMPVLNNQASTVPMPKVRLESNDAPVPMPMLGAVASPATQTKPATEFWSAIFDGQRSRK